VFVLPFGENFIVVGLCMFVDIIPQRDRQTDDRKGYSY